MTRDPRDRCALTLLDPEGLATAEEVRCALRPHDPAVVSHVLLVPEGHKDAAVFRWSGGAEAPVRVAFPKRNGAAVAEPAPATAPGGGGGRKARPTPEQRKDAEARGFTGDACGACGRIMLVRNGTCLLCRGCGATNGCS